MRRALALLALLGCGGTQKTEDWVSVRRDDLSLDVEVSGVLRAVKTDFLGPPAIPDLWEYKVALMAPEGKAVKKGEPVLGFDTSLLQRWLDEKSNERDSVRKQLEKKLSDAQLARRDEGLKIAEAEAKQRKAQLKVDRPTDLTGSIELAQARLDYELAQKETGYQKARAESARKADDAELAALRELFKRAEERVKEIQGYMARMTLPAPRDGTVIYYTDRRDMKKKVGDSAWRAEKVLETADLSEMLARGEVDEVDSSRVAVGQRVKLRLDAHPDQEFGGHVQSIARIVQRQTGRNALKVMRIEIALDRTDSQRMRPGMRFRGSIETGRIDQIVLVPADAIFVTDAGPVAWRKTATGYEAARLQLGRRNRDLVEVRTGLSPGDRVSRIDLGGGRS